jgi:hypothetical protein
MLAPLSEGELDRSVGLVYAHELPEPEALGFTACEP